MEELWSEVMSDPKLSLGQDVSTVLAMNEETSLDLAPSEGTSSMCENGMCLPQVSSSGSIEMESMEVETSQSVLQGSSDDDDKASANSFSYSNSDPTSTNMPAEENSLQDLTMKVESNVKQTLSDILLNIDYLESKNTLEYSITSDQMIKQKSEELKNCGNEEVATTGSKEEDACLGSTSEAVDADLIEGSDDMETMHAEINETVIEEAFSNSETSKLEDLSGTDDKRYLVKDLSNITSINTFDKSVEENPSIESADKKTLSPESSASNDCLEQAAKEESQNGAGTVSEDSSNETNIDMFDECVSEGNGCLESADKKTSLCHESSAAIDILEQAALESQNGAGTVPDHSSNETNINTFNDLEGNGYIESVGKTSKSEESSAAVDCPEQATIIVGHSSAGTLPEDTNNKISINISDEYVVEENRSIVSENKMTSMNHMSTAPVDYLVGKNGDGITPEDSFEVSINTLEKVMTEGNGSLESAEKKTLEAVSEDSFNETSINICNEFMVEGNGCVKSADMETSLSYESSATVDFPEQTMQEVHHTSAGTVSEGLFNETIVNTQNEFVVEGNGCVKSADMETPLSYESSATVDCQEQEMQEVNHTSAGTVSEDSFNETIVNTHNECVVEGNECVKSADMETSLSYESSATVDCQEQEMQEVNHTNAGTVSEDSLNETIVNTQNEFVVERNGCVKSADMETSLSNESSATVDCQEQEMQEVNQNSAGTVSKDSFNEPIVNTHNEFVSEGNKFIESADKTTSVSHESSAGIACMEQVMQETSHNGAGIVQEDSFDKPSINTCDKFVGKGNGCLGSADKTTSLSHESFATVDCLGQAMQEANQNCSEMSEMSKIKNSQAVTDCVQVGNFSQKEQFIESEKQDPCKPRVGVTLNLNKTESIQPTIVTGNSVVTPDESGSCKEDSRSKNENSSDSMEMSWSEYQDELSKTDPPDQSNSIPNFNLEDRQVDQSDSLMNVDIDSSEGTESENISSSVQSEMQTLHSEHLKNSVSENFQETKKEQAKDMDAGNYALSKDEGRPPGYNVPFDSSQDNNTTDKSLVKIESTEIGSDFPIDIQTVATVSEYTDHNKEECLYKGDITSKDTSESVSQKPFIHGESESFSVESEHKSQSFVTTGDIQNEMLNTDKNAITVSTSNIKEISKTDNSQQHTNENFLQTENMEVNNAQSFVQSDFPSSDSKVMVATQSCSMEISDTILQPENVQVAHAKSSLQSDLILSDSKLWSASPACIKENVGCPSGVINEKISDTLNRLVPKKAKARKSGVPMSWSRGSSIVKDFTNVTFNLKDLEKAGVVDLAPKPGQKTIIKNRLSIGSVNMNMVFSKSSGSDNSPLDKKLKPVSPKKSPLKSPLSPEKLMRRHSRKRKRVKMGSYRLPSEIKKIKREKERKKEKEDSDSVKSDSDSRINISKNSLAEKMDRDSRFVNSVESSKCDNHEKVDDPNRLVSALDMLTKNSKNSFSPNLLAKKSKTSSIICKRTGPKTSVIPQKGTLDSYLKKNHENFPSLQNSNFKSDDSNSRPESNKRDKSMEDVHQDITSAKKKKTDPVTLSSSHSIHQSIQQVIQQVPLQSSQILSAHASFSKHHSYTTTSVKPTLPTTPAHYTLVKPTLGPPHPYSQHAAVKSPTGQPQIIHLLNPNTPGVQKGALRSLLPTFTSVQGPITLLASPPNSENGQSVPNGTIKPVPMVLISSPVTSGTMTFAIAHTAPSSSFVSNSSLPRTAILTTKAGQPLILTPVQGSSPLVAPQTYSLLANHTTAGMDPKSANVGNVKPSSSVSEVGIASQAPVLNRLLTQSLSSATPLSTISSPVIAHVHSSEGRAEGEGKVTSLPNGLCYPVTPPRTPDGSQSSADSQEQEGMAVSPDGTATPDRDVIPLCCCKINGASFQKLASTVTYCQALDSVDGKVMGCCNKVSNPQLVRPAVKIPFMAVCEVHRKRLRLHQCCPGCGHFCTQGKFYQCRKEGSPIVHNFHKLCQVFKSGKYFCPHCGEGSSQYEVMLQLNDSRNNSTASLSQDVATKRAANKAKMGAFGNPRKSKGDGEEDTVIKHTLENSKKILSTAGIPLGPDRYSLEKVLTNLSQERPKKYRTLPKSLYLPARDGDLDKVVYMLEDGHEPDLKNEEENDETALHAASGSGSLAVVHVLAQAGASIHVQERNLRTPLMYASESNHPDIVKYLIKAGAIVDAKADDGMTALHYAAKEGHLEVIRILLDTQQIDIDIKDDGGWTPLIWAAEHQNVHVVRFLLQNGADPNLRDNEENTSLHWAAFSGSVDIAEIILNTGCDLDTPNMHGDRPLHIAARQDHYECVVLYLARGADVEAKNNKDEAPIGCCIDQNSPVWLALRVNKQLKGFAAKRLGRPEKLLHRDISKGRENIPIPCVNAVDEELVPQDFQYVTDNVETSQLNINRVLGSLQSCHCKDDCSSMFCACGRSSVRCWYDKDAHLIPEFNMLEPPFIFECNRACKCWTTCNNRVVQNGVLSRLQVFRTAGRGWGVKTLVNIPHGTFICEYIGEYISDSEADRREDDSYLFDLDNRDGETYCIDARRYGNVSRFINHLCEPNLVPVKVFIDHQDLRFPRISFFSSRDIKAQEELGFDYGEKFWIIKWKQFTCSCGSPRCKYSMETIQKTLADYKARHEEEDPKQE
ncbi:hypothetical protein ACJMK2_040274 [Sinanodonta woodiana]|uniref:Uncharacterized protein n=1 Tax=Sinanodonta woodiana TaxID=1069815 RepID=A0ABD3WEJ6_SINWO